MPNVNIATTAPHLAWDFLEEDQYEFDLEKYQQFIADNISQFGIFAKYLIGSLHDSWVTAMSVRDDLFSVTLNDFSTHVMADALVSEKNLSVDPETVSFAVQLDFKTISRVKFYTVEEDGSMHEIEPIELNEYLNEQVLSVSNNEIELAFEFWKDGNRKVSGQRIVLLLTATSIVVNESKDSAWQKLFGSTYDNYYHYFKKQFESGRNVSSQHECTLLIREYDATH